MGYHTPKTPRRMPPTPPPPSCLVARALRLLQVFWGWSKIRLKFLTAHSRQPLVVGGFNKSLTALRRATLVHESNSLFSRDHHVS